MPGRGLHHVTAISARAPRNRDFYTRLLGLRLVKRTVAYEDPGSWHLYYGDRLGRPGTLVSFFSWQNVPPGRSGAGEAERIAFRASSDSLDLWAERLAREHVPCVRAERFGEATLLFSDPDGTPLAIVTGACALGGDTDGPLGLREVTLTVRDLPATAAVLTNVLGFTEMGREDETVRFVAHGASGGCVCLRAADARLPRGRVGAGTIHHIAFRASDDAERAAMAAKLASDHGIIASEPKDRSYFRSVMFREPCGTLMEIATDGPGFLADEAADALGEALILPAWLEERRGEIEAILPPLDAS